MKTHHIKRIVVVFLMGILLLPGTSCNKEYVNPSEASVPSVVSSPDALMALCAGLQRRYTIGKQSPFYCYAVGGAYSVYALTTINVGNTSEKQVEDGKSAISPLNNSFVRQMWAQCLLTRTESETVLNNLNVATDPADRAGLNGYASIFYALSMGMLVQFYEQIPLGSEQNATFTPRAEVLKKVIAVLESADADLNITDVSTKFTSKMPAGINVKHTVKALLARFYNMQSMITGTYNAADGNKAIAYAGAASKTVKSEFQFTSVTFNPIGNENLSVNVFGARDSTLGLRNGLAPVPAVSDPRVGYYISQTGPTTYPLKAFALNLTASYPVYLPGEMYLIIAENRARQGQIPDAIAALNTVRTKKAADDIYGIGADQPPYSGALTQAAILTEIYKQRRLEMFLSGQELEDSRRFGRPGPNQPNEERNRNFYPYPSNERDNNSNTPEDPVI